jgi:hypothetical protein
LSDCSPAITTLLSHLAPRSLNENYRSEKLYLLLAQLRVLLFNRLVQRSTHSLLVKHLSCFSLLKLAHLTYVKFKRVAVLITYFDTFWFNIRSWFLFHTCAFLFKFRDSLNIVIAVPIILIRRFFRCFDATAYEATVGEYSFAQVVGKL